MTHDLESYLQALVKIPKIARMIYVKHFFIVGELEARPSTQTTDEILNNLISPDTEMDFHV
jgi:hypothetical protein